MTEQPAPPELRPAQSDDAGTIAEIWHLGWRDGHLGHVPDALLAERTPASFHARAPLRLDDTTVVEVDGEVAGFIMVVGNELEQIYVASGHRGLGIAGLLLSDAEQRIAAAGHEVAWLAVVTGNARARSFYTRQGWTDEGLFTYEAAGQDQPVDVPCQRYTRDVTSQGNS